MSNNNKEIPVIYTPASFEHNPPFEVFNGREDTAQENITRIASIMKALRKTDFANIQIAKNDALAWVEKVHDPDYLDYLKKASELAKKEEEAIKAENVKNGKPEGNVKIANYPSVHPYVVGSAVRSVVGDRGRYVFDTYTPIMDNTFEVAVESAACAVTGAKLLLEGQDVVYALSRPPGHHAEKGMAGGYCYVNNVAVAAEYLIANDAKKVAIFDFDFHHGNGTQDIFYDRPDVLVVNINAKPENKFPYFTGSGNEIGRGEGEGTNYNLPLPPGTKKGVYHEAVTFAANLITKYKPDYLVVSAGFDTHESDPICDFKLTTEYYRTLGRTIRALHIPTLSVQEGGYATDVLGENVVSYLSGLMD